ncbi:MAG: hypothetical protein U0528_04140 [Anaerolineae bacterium]
MRSVISKIVAVAVIFAGIVGASFVPALADGGGSPFSAGDGRYAPMTGDRIAVYVQDSDVAVWGIDGNLVGFPLTTFSLSELEKETSVTHIVNGGTVTLTKLSDPVLVEGYANYDATEMITQVETPSVYVVSWTDSVYGANGSGAFSKTFEATYLAQ